MSGAPSPAHPSATAIGSIEPTVAGESVGPATEGSTRVEADLAAGAVVGRYVVLGQLGAGGMGVVYAAYDPELDRKVALKVLRRAVGGSPESRVRQLREAQVLARLAHPNVVGIFDVGTYADRTWIAMERVEGVTLREWSRQQPRGWREVLDVMLPAGRGLAAAHAANVTHRDVKPDNIMVSGDGTRTRRTLVMDFGLARPLDRDEDSSDASRSERVVSESGRATIARAGGTPGYMAPEQHLNQVGDARIDQFGYCVTLWEALYRQRPFIGDGLGAVLLAITRGEVTEPPAGARVPRWVRRVLERGLAALPDKRWPTMDALLDELSRGQTIARRRATTLGVALATLLVAGAIGQRWVADRRAERACADAGAAIGETWPGTDDATRTRMRDAFAASGHAYAEDAFARLQPRLDDWSEEWHEHRQAECNAGRGDRDPRLHAAAIACLEERHTAFGVLVDALAEADAGLVRRSVAAAASLPRPEACADEDALRRSPLPPDGTDRERIAALRRELAGARSLVAAGRYAEGRARAQAVLDEAEPLGFVPLTAAAQYEVGRGAEESGDMIAAETHLQASYIAALSVGDDEQAAEAASALVAAVGADRDRLDDGRLWGQHAQALLARIGDDEGLRMATLELRLGRLDRLRGALDEAIVRLEHAIAIRTRIQGEDHPDLAGPRNNLANVYLDTGALDDAARLYESAHAGFVVALGPLHPDTALSINNLGTLQFMRGDFDGAAEKLRRALEIREQALGPDHPEVGESLYNVALIEYRRGDVAEAVRMLERALGIYEQSLGPDHRRVAEVLFQLGTGLVDLGRRHEARAHFQRTLGIRERSFGPRHPAVADALVAIGRVDALHGDVDEAHALGVRARAIAEENAVADPQSLMNARVFSGSIELERGDARAALRMCEQAVDPPTQDLTSLELSRSARLCKLRAEFELGGAAKIIAPAEALLAEMDDGRELAVLRWLLARALWESERDRSRALELAREAARALEATHPTGKAQIDAWLRARGGRASGARAAQPPSSG